MKRNQQASLVLLLLMTVLTSVFAYLFDNHTIALAAPPRITGEEIAVQLDKVGGTIEEIRVDGWIKLNCQYMTLSDLHKQVQDLVYLLNKDEQPQVEFGETTDFRQASLMITNEGMNFNIIVYNTIHFSAETDSYETYIIMNSVLESDTAWKEEQAYQKVQELLTRFGDSPSIGTTYTAVISNKLSIEEMNQRGRQLVSGLHGNITENNRDTEWVSLTGYSSRIGGGLDSIHGKFNLNVALRYHSYQDKTYIRLGTPVISIPY